MSLELSLSNDYVIEKETIFLTGDWTIESQVETLQLLLSDYRGYDNLCLLDGKEIRYWDSLLVSLLLQLNAEAAKKGISITYIHMPDGVLKLIELTQANTHQKRQKSQQSSGLVARLGDKVITDLNEAKAFFHFLGESILSLGRLVRGRAQYRRKDLLEIMSDTGPEALPIITLISVLVGVILAFVGAVQLKQFGAEIYVADLVGIAMVREMGCMMTGIIMAGRTGAAFAARIGTMQVNEEIDAFKTLGFSAMDFLVLPRILALVLMMPLLCLYANIVGILGGAAISIGAMGLSFTEYWNQTLQAIAFSDIVLGLVKAFIFGIVIAITGCMNGIQSGRSASAVGDAATSAVVSGVVFIIVIDGLFAIVTSVLGI